MSTIEALGVTKRYGATVALDSVSFSLAAGVAYGVLGPNGSGKSTLLRLLATLERPTEGRVVIVGSDAFRSPRNVRRALGFVPEEPSVQSGLSVGEQLDFTAKCYGLRRRERLAALDTMLELVDLTAWRDKPAVELSRGLRQRLAMATALVHNPTVLLLDEPMAGLDAAGRSEMLEVLKELRAMGKTILLSSHTVEDISHLCDAVGVLQRGRLIASGTINEIFSAQAPRELIIRVDVSTGLETAHTVVMQVPQAREIAAENGRLRFVFDGPRGDLPAVLERLISAGVQVAEFATEGQPLQEALIQAMQERR